jgi:hypothetical protein
MTNFHAGQDVVVIQTFKTEAFHNGKKISNLKFQAGRKGTFTRVVNAPKLLAAAARDIYVFVLPYGVTRYEVRLSLDEVKKYLAVEGESSNEQVPQKWTAQIPQIQQPSPVVQTPQLSRADEIAKLAELKERGLLTDDEFAIEKARILNQPGN